MAQDQTIEKRSWLRREVDFTASLIFPSRGLREVHTARFIVQNISEGGASLYIGGTRNVPDFFYLQFEGERSKMVGCYLVARTNDVLRCQFSPVMTTEEIEGIIARKSMTSMLASLFDSPTTDDNGLDLSSLF